MTASYPDFAENFINGRTQLAWQWIPGDLETPVSAFLKLCGQDSHAFLLESVEGGAVLGRYSVIGLDPDIIWSFTGGAVSLQSGTEAPARTDQNPLESLRSLLAQSRIDSVPDSLPPMAVSGLFGYMGYGMVHLAENIPDTHPDDLGIPDSVLIRPRMLAIFDNIKHMICLVTPVYDHMKNSKVAAQDVYETAHARLENAIQKLSASIPPSSSRRHCEDPGFTGDEAIQRASMTEKEFHAAVLKAQEHIAAGDIFQVVLAQRFSADFDLPPLELYRALRTLNPSPFMFYFAYPDFALVGSSPEILVRVRDNTVTIRPIAGTRKRGGTPEEDRALAEDLLADPKERAEHLMLLDLGRNDVGRVAQFGSVRVTEQFAVEYYSHVMHIVSNVEGALREDLDILDALLAGFPAGTVSGAPKVRAMEIIDALEKTRRS
ncbi:MAG: chorismate-binding protein, partial [Alphaproteobacteria bacterium]|nr:chorismate-binding protein [Alphaproteobacteria bacterium]